MMEPDPPKDILAAVIGHANPGIFCANLVRRVLDLALDDGHPDPRHSEHWWDWQNWPIDGRQWEHEGCVNRYMLNKNAVAEHEKRVRLGGIGGSKLKIERKLEGAFWGEKQFPNGRTSVRSSGCFPLQLFQSTKEEEEAKNEEDESSSEGESPNLGVESLFVEACGLADRSSYDASIADPKKHKIMKVPLGEKFKQDFEDQKPFDKHFGLCECDLLNVNYYICTDNFATKGEQKSSEMASIPSLSVQAIVFYTDQSSGIAKVATVVAEAPTSVLDFVDQLDDRIAGFVFRDDDIDGTADAVRVTYVESCSNDLQTLDHDAKDALLEDRALVVHRLVQNAVAKQANKTELFHYPQVVSSPFHLPVMKPLATGFPPTRTLETLMTIHRADPRWPLVKPNSSCLECGREPKSSDGKLLVCSKCSVRTFCSSECMAKSWKSDVWCHRVECKRLCEHQKSMMGQSMREMFNKLTAKEIVPASVAKKGMSVMEKHIGQASLDEKFESVSEMREKHREDARGVRKARKSAKKKKKGKK